MNAPLTCPVTVLISEADEAYRQVLHGALVAARGLQVTGVAGSLKDTLALARTLRPDTILLSTALVNGDGAQAAEAGLFQASKVLLLSEAGADTHILKLLQWGARGCLVKGVDLLERLPEALRAVQRGEAVLTPRLTGWMLDALRQPPGPGTN